MISSRIGTKKPNQKNKNQNMKNPPEMGNREREKKFKVNNPINIPRKKHKKPHPKKLYVQRVVTHLK